MIFPQSDISYMDKDAIILMLQSIKDTASIGPQPEKYNPGDQVLFALDRGLLKRAHNGNLVITPKGESLLTGLFEWSSLQLESF
jgi:hypothetical protein